jgi:hypothetical protein
LAGPESIGMTTSSSSTKAFFIAWTEAIALDLSHQRATDSVAAGAPIPRLFTALCEAPTPVRRYSDEISEASRQCWTHRRLVGTVYKQR